MYTQAIKLCFLMLLLLAVQSPLRAAKLPVIESVELTDGTVIEFDSSSETPILEYRVMVDMLANADQSKPRLQVFADGRVRAHNPVYMKKAGDYESQLSRKALRELIGGLADRGMLKHDKKDFDAKKNKHDRFHKHGLHDHVSDDVYTEIDVRLHSVRDSHSSESLPGFHKKVKLRNIHADGKHYRDVIEVQRMQRNVDAIRSLMKHSIEHGARSNAR